MNNSVVLKERESNSLYLVKAFAIICVIFAHLSFYNSNLANIFSIIGTIGVPIFFIISGYLLKGCNEKQSDAFWFGKLKSVVVPWCLYAILTYVIHIIMDGNTFSIIEMIKWQFGYLTWLYFVPVFLILLGIGRLLYRIVSKPFFWIVFIFLFLLSITSKYLTAKGVLKITDYLTPYQNPFNFLCYFLIGILFRKLFINGIPSIRKTFILIIAGLVVLLFIFRIFIPIPQLPLVFIKIIFNTCLCITLFYVFKHPFLNAFVPGVFIGKHTYIIYFLHMQLGVSVIKLLFETIGVGNVLQDILSCITPIFIILYLGVAICLIKRIFKKINKEKYLWPFAM